MLARRYEFYVLVARTISHSFAALTRGILSLPLEHKIHIFSPPCNILYLVKLYLTSLASQGRCFRFFRKPYRLTSRMSGMTLQSLVFPLSRRNEILPTYNSRMKTCQKVCYYRKTFQELDYQDILHL